MANLTSSQIKDSYQSVLTTSETTSDPTTGTLQNGKGTAITTLTVSGTVNATTLGGTLSTASQPNVTSVGTLTSATITGDLTVDTSTLKVDSANNRVGVGTASPDTKLEVAGAVGTGTSLLKLYNNSSSANDNIAQIDFELDNSFSGVNVDAQITVIKTNAGNHESALLLKTASGTGSATERMRIDASGTVNIGLGGGMTSTYLPKLLLHTAGGANFNIGGGSNTNDTVLSRISTYNQNNANAGNESSAEFYGITSIESALVTSDANAGTDSGGYLFFKTKPEAGVLAERMRITSDASAYLRLASGTAGIQFNGDTAAANALDDYEEGIWTPTAADAASGGVTTTTGTGHYTKIGRMVYCTGTISSIDTTGMTAGNIFYIRGLPFSQLVQADRGFGCINLSNVTFSGYCTVQLPGGTTVFSISTSATGAATGNVVVSSISTGTASMQFSFYYYFE
jgi:hypothetical protein